MRVRAGAAPAVLLVVAAAAGCAPSAADCDPRAVASLLTAGGCAVAGRYEERAGRLRVEADAAAAERAEAEARARRATAEVARQDMERARLLGEADSLDAEVAGLGRDAADLKAAGARERAGLTALQARSRELRGRIASPGGGGAGGEAGAGTEEEIRALTAEVERRRAAIRAILEGMGASS